MDGLARISFSSIFSSIALLMPASGAYDKDGVFEEAGVWARRYGPVTLEFDRRVLCVRPSAPESGSECARCGRRTTVTFATRDNTLCQPCARELVELG